MERECGARCSSAAALTHSVQSTLFLGSVFMVAVGAAPNFVGMAALLACAGVGIGGNLPVDGSLLLECA